jgi:hypothetical protein
VTQSYPSGSPDPALRATVASIDRLRRSRATLSVVARMAPYAAGLGLLLALASRWFGWSWYVPGAFLVLSLAAAIGSLIWGRRAVEVSDAAATMIDERAGLGGELHSAHWFAANDAPHAAGDVEPGHWSAYHLKKAAARISATDWPSLYPPVRAAKQWMASAALVAVAVIALLNGPRSTAAILAEQGLSAADAEMAQLEMLPADIQKKIDELLAAIKAGELSPDAARLKVGEIRALLDKLNASMDEKSKGKAADAEGGQKPSDDEGDKLAKKAEELADSSAGLPEDVRWSIDDLASRLANADAAKRETNKENASASEQTGEKGAGSDEAEKAQMAESAGMQMVREAATDAAQGQMMNGGGGAMGGDSRPGAGGNQGGQGEAKMAALQQALRQEMIQAQADLLGQTVDTEIRRKTEQSQAKVGFSRVATPTSFDRSRAALPPPVPEAHRSLLQRYFHRSK